MEPEIDTSQDDAFHLPPPDVTGAVVVVEDDETKPADKLTKEERKAARKEEEKKEARDKAYNSKAMTEVRTVEDRDLKSLIDGFGTQGSWKCEIKRLTPTDYKDPVTFEIHSIKGHLETVEEPFDEDWLKGRYGGGKYNLVFKRKDQRGTFVHATARAVDIAGPPIVARQIQPQSQSSPHRESDTVTKTAMEMMSKANSEALAEARRAADDARNRGDSGSTEIMLRMFEQSEARSKETISTLTAQIERLASVKPPEAPKNEIQDKILSSMIDGDSARLTAMRHQLDTLKETHASEIKQLREHAREDEKRANDRFDRELAAAANRHQRELDDVRAASKREVDNLQRTHELNVSMMKANSEVVAISSKSAADASTTVLQGEVKRLERDNIELRNEIKMLREKKDVSIMDMVDTVDKIRDKVGGDGEDKSTIERVAESVFNPQSIEAIGAMFNRGPAAQQVQQQPQVPQQPQIMQAPNGQAFAIVNGRLVPARKQKRAVRQVAAPAQPQVEVQVDAQGNPVAVEVAPAEDLTVQVPEAPELPEIDPTVAKQMILYFEGAYGSGQDPKVFAQSVKPRIPEQWLMYLGSRITDLGVPRGVDDFLIRVAELPGSSPLATLAGKNWIRGVAKELVGE